MKQTIVIVALLFSAAPSFAQPTKKIETDRPDQTESPFVVPLHYLQGEAGFNQETFKDGTKQFVHPTTLLKYGLSNRFELRFEASPYTESSLYFSPKQTKLEPIEIGTKVRLFEEKGWRPKTSLIANVGLPFAASKEYHDATLLYGMRLTMQNTLSETVALGYNFGVEKDAEAVTSVIYTFAPGFNIGAKWYAYAEVFGSFSTAPEHNIDGGIAFNPSPHTKIDVSGGFGLGDSPLKNYMAIGFSFRIPLGRRPLF